MKTLEAFGKKYKTGFYVFARIVVGYLFFMHGYAKLAAGLSGLMLVAGIVEVAVGAVLVLGLFTRLAAAIGAIQMIVAIALRHLGGWNPLQTGAELPLLFIVAFLMFIVGGNSVWSLEKVFFKKESF